MAFKNQRSAFQDADTKGWTCIYKVFPGHRFGTAPNPKALSRMIMNTPRAGRVHWEVLRDGVPLCTYWDIDAYFDDPGDQAARRAELITAFHELLFTAFPDLLGEAFQPGHMRWADSSGYVGNGCKKWKLSLHAIYADPAVGWAHCHSSGKDQPRNCLNEFVKLLVARSEAVDCLWYLEQDGDVVTRKSMIDLKAYSANRALRCLGCHKPGDSRVLMPLDTFSVSKDIDVTLIAGFLVSNWTPSRMLAIRPRHLLLSTHKATAVTRHWIEKLAAECGCDVDEVKGSLITLKTRANRTCKITGESYGRIHNRCYLILREGMVIYKQHGVEGEFPLAEYDTEKEYEFYSDTYKLRQRAVALKDNFARSHMESFVRDVVSYVDRVDDPVWLVTVDKGRRAEFTNTDLPVPHKSHILVENLWAKRSAPSFMTFEMEVDDMGVAVVDKKGNPVLEKTRIRLSKIANEMASAGRLRIYEDVTWHPYCPGASRPFIGRNVYNMFEGFPLSHIRPNGVPFEQHAIYDLMRTQLTISQDGFEYVLNYIAHKLQYPAKRIDTALCFARTTQGIGKGQFGTFIQNLFGPENVTVCSNLDNVFTNFNHYLSKCLWLILEEMESGGKGWSNSDRLKDMISANKMVFEQKFKTPRVGAWYGQVLMFSNHSYGIKLENSDRRHVLLDTCASRRDDVAFHNLIAKQTTDSNYMAVAYDWFLKRDVSNWNWRKLPKTKTRDVIKRGCESCWLKFTRWLFEHECNFYEGEGYNPDKIGWEVDGDNIIAITNARHITVLFRHSKVVEGFHSKVDESTIIVDSLLFLWKSAAKEGRFRTRSKWPARRSIRIDVRDLQKVLSIETRSVVEFGCFELTNAPQ